MADIDPWAGLVDPRAALKAAREAAANFRKLSQPAAEGCESGSVVKSDAYANSSNFRSFRRGAVELSQDRGNSTKDRKETCSSLSNTYTISSPSAGQNEPDPSVSADGTPAKAAKARKYELTHSESSETAFAGSGESFAVTNTVPGPIAHLSGPKDWRDGLARLDRWAPPCEGFRSGEWEGVHRAVSHFMDHCAVEAAARGWTALDLFGVHYLAGAAAVDGCGALMLPGGGVVTSVSADALAFGHLVYRKRPMPQSVLVWNLVKVAA
jgi:hypothetical protein